MFKKVQRSQMARKIIEEYVMSTGEFNLVHLLEPLSNCRNKGRRIIFNEFGVEKWQTAAALGGGHRQSASILRTVEDER